MKPQFVQAESVDDRHGYSLWARNQPYRLPRFHQSPRRPMATGNIDDSLYAVPRYPMIPPVSKRVSVGSAIESLIAGLLLAAVCVLAAVVW